MRLLSRGDIICLFGTLGAGKTIFVKGMAKGLGIRQDKVISPSFVIIREYRSAQNFLYHFDLYRLKNPRDILNLGYEEYLYGQGISVIEWAERMAGYLPPEFLRIEFKIKDQTQRAIKLIAEGQRYQKLLKKFKRRFLS